jgi:hypothetical protein
MNESDLRLALAVGWLVDQLAQATKRSVPQVSADLFNYLDTIDAFRHARK